MRAEVIMDPRLVFQGISYIGFGIMQHRVFTRRLLNPEA